MAFVLLFSSCATSQQAGTTTQPDLSTNNGTGARKTGMSKTAKGGLIGAGTGAAAGAILGRIIGGGRGTAIGAIVGAAAGGTTGAIIGRKMDKQAADLQKDMQNAKVERVGEGIKITFDSGILFDTNSATLRAASMSEGRMSSAAVPTVSAVEPAIQRSPAQPKAAVLRLSTVFVTSASGITTI